MSDPEEKTISVAPGGQVVYIGGQSDFLLPPQKRLVQRPPIVSPSPGQGLPAPSGALPTYSLGGDLPEYTTFAEAPAIRPNIVHDHGFLDSLDGKHNLDAGKMRAPTITDRVMLEWWIHKLEAALCARPDLADATSAYAHFLYKNGEKNVFNYERYVGMDASGRTALRSAMEDVISAAVEVHDAQLYLGAGKAAESSVVFELTSDAVTVSSQKGRYPYPATENWQKAIGGHTVWMSAVVSVSNSPSVRTFGVTMTLHAEDMYNFNPGQADIVTGAPDNDNGRFEVTGLGCEFWQTASLVRMFSFTADPRPAMRKRYTPSDLDFDAVIRSKTPIYVAKWSSP